MTELRLEVENLSIDFHQQRAVDKVSFQLGRERVALVGESGSGKSITARSLMGLVRQPGKVSADRLCYYTENPEDVQNPIQQNLLTLKPRQWSKLRGNDIAMVLQDPRYALNPVQTIGKQVEESLLLHNNLTRADSHERVLNALASVGLTEDHYHNYPAQLSGGMGQRAMLAIALVNNPRILIADEPTSALDAKLRNQILDLIVEQTEQRDMSLLLISHDLPLVTEHCDRVLVMYQGKLVDQGLAADLPHSTHPYTHTLWACRPNAHTFGTDLPVLDRQVDMFGGQNDTD
ncbi:ABC transporter ATP-binding protein [Yersinia nurmii]|uniref:ABC-type dipeptide transporter n=1 Tax=Yersinia nurmii TaxID=685706 RepID=A0AAW7K3D6_9GAMM|nr:ABC transporter ATP-binding protein [Yersinia nurmii]MDN0088496.1 ABC transporter ATP-binding protein [Yersinia nurmii]CNE80738.1 putative ABC transporter transporter%2C ATP-binding protein [Yersinia nurmii]